MTARHSTDNFPFARAFRFLVVLAGFSVIIGCGKPSADVAKSETVGPGAAQGSSPAIAEPTEIVSQFLDRVRRGGDDSGASELLTRLAQQEMTRIGRPLQFPGSPDTTYSVKNALPVPNQTDAMWVHTVLAEPVAANATASDPSATGSQLQYEVVWTLRKETSGWRISGFVIDQGENLSPLEIDFENGDEMEARLAAIEGEQSADQR